MSMPLLHRLKGNKPGPARFNACHRCRRLFVFFGLKALLVEQEQLLRYRCT